MSTRLGVLALAFLAALGLLGTAPARAAWNNTGSGPAVQSAMVMPASLTPTVTMANGLGLVRTYTVTWPRTEVQTGVPVTGYTITRTSTRGSAVLGLGTCQGISLLGLGAPVYVPAEAAAAMQSCTEIAVVDLGVVRYSVTPVYGRWTGSSSAWSFPVG